MNILPRKREALVVFDSGSFAEQHAILQIMSTIDRMLSILSKKEVHFEAIIEGTALLMMFQTHLSDSDKNIEEIIRVQFPVWHRFHVPNGVFSEG